MTLDQKQLETILKSAETIVSVVKDALDFPDNDLKLLEWVKNRNDWITIGKFRDQFSLGEKAKKIVKEWSLNGLVTINEDTMGKIGPILRTKFKCRPHTLDKPKQKISFFEFVKNLQRFYREIALLGTGVNIAALWRKFQLHTDLPKEIFESFLADCFYLFPTQIRFDPTDRTTDTGIKIKNTVYSHIVMFQPIYR